VLGAVPAEAAPQLVKVGDFNGPTYATAAPGDASRVFVTERAGRVRLIRDGAVVAAPFLDLTSITESAYDERGLLSAAFAPDYATSGRFYVYLTATAAAAVSGTIGELQVREYRRSATSPDVADPASARLLLSIPHTEAQNHNGGQLQFGPDGQLWLGTGDGGGSNNQFGHAQDPASLLGKLIRIAPAAPAPEVMARGLRNPWRFSFDRATGQLVVGDVGQDGYEEVDFGLAANYGWPCFEGKHAYRTDPGCDGVATAMPALELPQANGFCSVVGGYVVRDPGLPTLAGRYLYGDFCAPALRSADLANPASDAAVGLSVDSLSSFGEDACGRILVVSLAGPVYRLVDGTPSPCVSAGPPPPVPAPADTRACALSARITGVRSVRRLRRLTVSLRTDEACRATVSARIRGVATFRTAKRSLVAGRRSVVRLKLTARGTRAVRRALKRQRSLRVAVRVQALDATGNIRSLSRGVRVRG
jgi:hypothetical protein